MATSNEQIFDRYVRHQTYLIRYAGGLRNEVSTLLEGTESKLYETILAYAAKIEGSEVTNKKTRQLIKEMEQAILAARAAAWDEVDTVVTDQLKSLAVQEAAIGAGVIEGAVPVALGLQLPSVAHLQAIAVATPFEGKVLKDWMTKAKFDDAERIARAAKIGIVQGETPIQVARRVLGTELFGRRDGVARKARRDMESILLTATNGIQNEAKAALYKENSDVIQKEYFVATLDSHTTLECAGNDGSIWPLGEGPKPPLHFRCRSLRIPYINPDALRNRGFDPTTEKQLLREYSEQAGLEHVPSRIKDLPRGHKTKFDSFSRKRTRELVGQVPAKTTFDRWLRQQPQWFQDDYLGPTRAKMFRSGKIQLSKFTAKDGTELTLKDLEKLGYKVD